MGLEVKDLDQEEQQIRQEMDDTRSALTEKLETLEQKVASTVEDVTDTVATVTDAVQDTVETVKDSVQTTVETVKETFDLSLQVERRPWIMVGGAVVAGFVLGRVFPAATTPNSPPTRTPAQDELPSPSPPPMPAADPSWTDPAANRFGPEIAKLKSLALGTLFGLIRDTVRPILPEALAPQVSEVINNFTTKLGGEALPESLAPSSSEGCGSARQSSAAVGDYEG